MVEINCCGIALAAITMNLISLLVFFGYSVKMNKGNSGFYFSRDSLPINLKEFQTNYNKERDEKISYLEEMVKQLQSQVQNSEENKK
jgi:hypothetical protein